MTASERVESARQRDIGERDNRQRETEHERHCDLVKNSKYLSLRQDIAAFIVHILSDFRVFVVAT